MCNFDRLRELQRPRGKELFSRGESDGTAWARDCAEADELQRLAADQTTAFSNFAEFYAVIHPDYAASAALYCSEIVGDLTEDQGIADEPRYLAGFVQGALACGA